MLSPPKVINKTLIERVKRQFGIIGNTFALNHAIEMALRVAPTMMNVLITGENGSGKESFSKIIHHFSGKKHGKLIAVNCGALPEGTIDSELFGHEKGAFTGAHETRKGYFQEANGGTIFLDEIGEMPLATQSRLLRVLEYGEFLKVGSSKVEKTAVRVIAATHVDLREAMRQSRFREDLYYRLNTVSLRIPPLRERGDDVLLLFKKFSADFAQEYGRTPLQLTEGAIERLKKYDFPGNIRELKNLVVRMSILSYDEPMITEEILSKYLPSRSERLPARLSGTLTNVGRGVSERDILYKVLFDMQHDLIELKKLVFERLSMDVEGYHLLKKHPLLFDQLPNKKVADTPSPIVLPTQEEMSPPSPTSLPIEVSEDNPIIPLEEMEKQAIEHALKKYQGNRKKVAVALEIPERTLYRKIKKYGF
ncbi:MAG: sigma-54 dependent transcriptional regulator [Bacteroidota bacterium]